MTKTLPNFTIDENPSGMRPTGAYTTYKFKGGEVYYYMADLSLQIQIGFTRYNLYTDSSILGFIKSYKNDLMDVIAFKLL